MNPQSLIDQMFANAISSLTFGLVVDIQTALIAMVGLILLWVCFDLLKDAIAAVSAEKCQNSLREDADSNLHIMNDETGFFSKFDKDLARHKFRQEISILGKIDSHGCKK